MTQTYMATNIDNETHAQIEAKGRVRITALDGHRSGKVFYIIAGGEMAPTGQWRHRVVEEREALARDH